MKSKAFIKYHITALLSLFIILASCESEHGIAPKPFIPPPPPDETTGFSGRITFIGTWPDSIKRTHIVMFKNPLLTPADFNIFNLKYVSLEIPFGSEFYDYSSADSSFWPVDRIIDAGDYSYLAVAQQSTDTLTLIRKDWFVAGIYYAEGDTSQPGILSIPENTMVKNVDIVCDFNNPPPQPPGGN